MSYSHQRNMQSNNNTVLYAILGLLTAALVATIGYIAYNGVSNHNNIEAARRLYEIQHMSNDELGKHTDDPLAIQELDRRTHEQLNSLEGIYRSMK